MERSGLGILAPAATVPEVDPDVLLVPLLAFDRAGYRLGYGAGFYDRTLERLRRSKRVTAIGIGFAGQEVDSVPRDQYDQPLDWLVTERFVLKIAE
jgi:5-formyltetrahydrofolate cyclo-ligase